MHEMAFGAADTHPYVQVGSSGLFVYQVGLGTMQFGWSVDEAGAHRVLDAYVDRGGNFIDTADCYSSWASRMGGPENPGGVSEEIIGSWLKSRGRRDDLVIATKVRAAMGLDFADNRATPSQREGLSRRWIMQACEDSLRRLGVDHIDLYQAHFIDPVVPIEETMAAFTDLVRQGKVRYLGCSNFSAWRILESLWVSDSHGFEKFVSVQPEYNLLNPIRGFAEMELAPMCQHFGIGMVPYSPLAGGVLTGKYRKGQALPQSVRADENTNSRAVESNWEIIEAVIDAAEQLDRSPASVAVGWLLAKPWVSAPIIGANRPEQLDSTMDGLDTPLPAEVVSRLDDVSSFVRSRESLEQ
jgi:aryl-alcohol dehydrogenase-like predicted oxidoreductase